MPRYNLSKLPPPPPPPFDYGMDVRFVGDDDLNNAFAFTKEVRVPLCSGSSGL